MNTFSLHVQLLKGNGPKGLALCRRKSAEICQEIKIWNPMLTVDVCQTGLIVTSESQDQLRIADAFMQGFMRGKSRSAR